MGRTWEQIKANKEAYDRAQGRDVEADYAEAQLQTNAYVLGYRLAQLRAEQGLSQAHIARLMEVSQPRISQLENGDVDAMEVDTLRRYIAACGGALKIVADFDDHEVAISRSEVDREVYA